MTAITTLYVICVEAITTLYVIRVEAITTLYVIRVEAVHETILNSTMLQLSLDH